MVELKDTVLEEITGGGRHDAAPSYSLNAQKTNNSTIELFNFSVKGAGGLGITVVQTIS